MTATEDRIRRRRERLERLGKLAPATTTPTHLHLWHGMPLRPANDHGDGSGIDIVLIPSGRFLADAASIPMRPWHEWIRGFAHLDEIPQQTPRMPTLVDAPDNPIPEPASAIEHEPEPSPDPLRPKGVELDRDAVLIDLAEHRARQPQPQTLRDEARESMRRVRRKYERNYSNWV